MELNIYIAYNGYNSGDMKSYIRRCYNVPSGEHEVVLEYEAPCLKIGMGISGIFVGIALCMVLICAMKNVVNGKN